MMPAQTAAEMFVMVLDVHKWVPMPAIAARAKQSSSTALNAAGGFPVPPVQIGRSNVHSTKISRHLLSLTIVGHVPRCQYGTAPRTADLRDVAGLSMQLVNSARACVDEHHMVSHKGHTLCRWGGRRASLLLAGAHAAGGVHKRTALGLQRAPALRPAVPGQPCCADCAGKRPECSCMAIFLSHSRCLPCPSEGLWKHVHQKAHLWLSTTRQIGEGSRFKWLKDMSES